MIKRIKPLIYIKRKITGRASRGNLILYNRGGCIKKQFRIIDNKNYIWYVKGIVINLEYDPTRYSLLQLIIYTNGIMTYSLALNETKVGHMILTSPSKYLRYGDRTNLLGLKGKFILSNIELYFNGITQYAKTFGNYSKINIRLKSYSLIKLRSKEVIKLYNENIITLGSIKIYQSCYYKKASYFRYKGWRPHVRGVAKNPVDHPLGGGQGKTSGGRPSCNFRGRFVKGTKKKEKI